MPLNSSRIDRYQKKLLHLKKYYEWLEQWMKEIPLDVIVKLEDYRSLMGIYHTAQNAAAVIIDIIAMMNKDLVDLVQDNYQNIEILREEGIISNELKNGIRELVGLRNRLAHDYNGILDQLAWKSISTNLRYLNDFYKVISEWLTQQRT